MWSFRMCQAECRNTVLYDAYWQDLIYSIFYGKIICPRTANFGQTSLHTRVLHNLCSFSIIDVLFLPQTILWTYLKTFGYSTLTRIIYSYIEYNRGSSYEYCNLQYRCTGTVPVVQYRYCISMLNCLVHKLDLSVIVYEQSTHYDTYMYCRPHMHIVQYSIQSIIQELNPQSNLLYMHSTEQSGLDDPPPPASEEPEHIKLA